MNKILPRLLLLLISISLSYKLLYFISENYFFDIFFYYKSPEHGYTTKIWNPLENSNNPEIIEDRISDLRALVNLSKNSSVLGVSNEHDFFNIAIIGDSMVYGLGIRNDERLSILLEKKLNKIKPTKVYTLALPADGIIENYTKFLLAKKYYSPDLYIIEVLTNDLVFESFNKYPEEINIYKELKTLCPGIEFVKPSTSPNESYENMIHNQYYPSFSSQYSNVCILSEIIRKIIEQDKRVIFFSFETIPTNKLPDIPQTSAEKNQKILQILSEKIVETGGNVVDIKTDYDWFTPVSEKEGHPSNETNELFARILYNEITSNEEWGFSKK